MSEYAVVWDLNGVLFKRRVPDPDTFSIVKELKEKGVDQYVCTNTRTDTLKEWIKEYGIEDCFKEIFSARETGYLKPDVRMFKYLRSHIPNSKIVLVDDSYINIRVARLVGLKGIRYTSDQQLLNELKMLKIYK